MFGESAVVLVAMCIGLEIAPHAGPVAHVIPVEGGFDVENAAGFFHQGVVDGELRQRGELRGHRCCEVCAVAQLADEFLQWGRMMGEFADHSGHGPDKHACVPGEIALGEEGLGEFDAWLFTEAGDVVDGHLFLHAGEMIALAALHVAVAWAGPGGFDANGDEALTGLGGLAGARSTL